MSRRRATGPAAMAAALRRSARAASVGGPARYVRLYDDAGQASAVDPQSERGRALLAAASELIRAARTDAE